jgi:hypothetical protein
MAAVERRGGHSGSSYYDRGEQRCKAFTDIVRRWRREQGTQALSPQELAHEVEMRADRRIHRNDMRRVLDGDARLLFLTPEVTAAIVGGLDRTSPKDVAKAFCAIKLLPPEVEEQDLELAIVSARARRRLSGSQVA